MTTLPLTPSLTATAKLGPFNRSAPLCHPGIFDNDCYWDVTAEYAKASPNDVLASYTVSNRGPYAARLHVLPTLCA